MRENEIEIWRAHLDVDAVTLARLSGWLDPGERERAARFRFEQDRHRFIAARGFLRELLAAQLSASPNGINFVYSVNGKPSLASSSNINLRFNVSHAASLGLFAFAFNREIGVDLELIKEMPEMDAIARQTFTAQDVVKLNETSPAGQGAMFFRLWTRREAIAKCTGQGIAETKADVSFSGTVVELEPAPGYVGAVAVERGALELTSVTSSGRAPDDPVPVRIH